MRTKHLAAIALISLLSGPCLANEAAPTLTAALAQSSYSTLDNFKVDLTLAAPKDASRPIIVSSHDVGTVCVEKLTKDGQPLKPEEDTIVFFSMDPFVLQQGREVILQPGQSIAMSVDFYAHSNPKYPTGTELRVIYGKKFAVRQRSYFLTPGQYALQLCYQYKGSSNKGDAIAYHGKIVSNTVTFSLHDSPVRLALYKALWWFMSLFQRDSF